MTKGFFINLVLLLSAATFLGALELSIGGVFHEEWDTFNRHDSILSSTCFSQCYNICVSYHFHSFKTPEFHVKLRNLSHENHDVIIVGQPFVDIEDDHSLNRNLKILTRPYSVYDTGSFKRENTNDPTRKTSPNSRSNLRRFLSHYLTVIHQNTIIVLHDDLHTGFYVGDLLDYLTEEGVEVEMLVYSTPGLKTRSQWDEVLSTIHERFYTRGIYALLLGKSDTVLRTLTMVNSYDDLSNRTTNFRHLSHWLVLTDLDNSELFLPVVNRLENVVLVDIHTHRRPFFRIREVLDYLEGNVNKYFNLSTKGNSCTKLETTKTNFALYIQNVLTPQHEQLTILALHGVENRSRFDEVFLDDVLENSQFQDIIFPNKKYNWNGVHLLVSTKPWPGYVEKVTNGNQTGYEGMCVEMLKTMADALNFTYTIEDVPDGEWGSIVNESWTGLVRQLQDRVIDLALADITIHTSRATVMDYIYPTFKTEVVDILYRLHDDSDMSIDRLITPLKPVLLPIMAGSLCAITILYVVVEYAEELLKIRRRPWKIAVVFWKAAWHMIGSFLSQGGSESPRSCSGRLLMASWWLFCIIFAAMYSATLTVSFCVQRNVVPFTSLHDMVYSSDYKWGMFNGSINMLIFGTSGNPLYKTAYTRMMEFAQSDPSVLSKNMDVQLEKVVNDKYAFIAGQTSLNFMIKSAPNGVILTKLGENLYSSNVALGVPTDSPLLPGFEWVMGNMRETGILQYWIGQFWDRSQPKPDTFKLGGEPLPLKKLLNAFCLVAFGFSLALTVLLCETILKCLQKIR